MANTFTIVTTKHKRILKMEESNYQDKIFYFCSFHGSTYFYKVLFGALLNFNISGVTEVPTYKLSKRGVSVPGALRSPYVGEITLAFLEPYVAHT